MWKGLNTGIAITALTVLGLAAMKAGIDGIMLAGIAAAIAGLGGFITGRKTSK